MFLVIFGCYGILNTIIESFLTDFGNLFWKLYIT